MMEFLDKIYGSENFGIILFAVIMGLVVLFMIILFFGKRDEKKREIERTQKLEREAMNGFAETNNEAAPLEVAAPAPTVVEETVNVEEVNSIAKEMPIMEPLPTVDLEQPVLEPVSEPVLTMPVEEPITNNVEEAKDVVEPVIPAAVNLEPIVSSEPVNNIPVPEEPKKEIEIPNFNFEELAASIAQELSALEKQNQVVKEAVVEPEVKVEPVVEINNSVTEPTFNDLVRPAVETQKVTRPITFSSVYINKPAEPVAPVEPVTPVMPQEPVRMPEVTVAPVEEVTPLKEVVVAPVERPINPMPNIELPKPAEMPMLKQEVKQESVNNPTTVVPDFSQFEGESYDIK